MGTVCPPTHLEPSGGNSAPSLQMTDASELHEPPSLGWGLFLKRLIGERKKEIAAEYYPLPEGAEKRWQAPRIEAHFKQASSNLDRMLSDRDDHPPTLKLLDVVAKVLGPEAAVAIAHFSADRFGTERGAVKLNRKRVQDDLGVIKQVAAQGMSLFRELMEKVSHIEEQVSRKDGR
jgi:hypothetical protein